MNNLYNFPFLAVIVASLQFGCGGEAKSAPNSSEMRLYYDSAGTLRVTRLPENFPESGLLYVLNPDRVGIVQVLDPAPTSRTVLWYCKSDKFDESGLRDADATKHPLVEAARQEDKIRLGKCFGCGSFGTGEISTT